MNDKLLAFLSSLVCCPPRDNNRPERLPPEKLLHSLTSTSSSRFNAARRLSKKDRALTRVTAFTSGYLIVLTVLPYFVKVPQEIADNLNLISVVFAIVILVTTLLQYSSGDVVNAEQHHRAGLEMSEIARDLRNSLPNINNQQLTDFTARYSATLQKYSINHDHVDFQRYQLDQPNEYPWISWCERLRIRIAIFVTSHFSSVILVFITAFFVGLVFFYAYPARLSHHENATRATSAPTIEGSK